MKFSDLTVGRIVHFMDYYMTGTPKGCRAALVTLRHGDTVFLRVFDVEQEDDVVRRIVENDTNWHDPRECPENKE